MATIKKTDGELFSELLFLLYKMRGQLSIICVSVFIISMLLFKWYFIHYTSSVTFLIDTSDPAQVSSSQTEEFALSHLKEISNNRMYAILFSDEMVNRLEADIKICEHFNLDKTNPEFVHDARSILQSKINIVKGPYNVIRLETVDHDKKYAALFANAVYENLAAINRQIMINNLIYKKEVYRLNLDRWVSQSNKDAENFRQALYQLQTSGKSTRENPDEIFLLKRDLLNLISQYDRSASEQLKYEFKYQMASDAIIDSTLQTLYLINRAYPQNNYSSYFRAVMWSTGLCIAGAIYYCIMIFLVQKYKHNIKSIISTHQNEIHLNEIRTGNSNKNNEKLYDLKNSETEA